MIIELFCLIPGKCWHWMSNAITKEIMAFATWVMVYTLEENCWKIESNWFVFLAKRCLLETVLPNRWKMWENEISSSWRNFLLFEWRNWGQFLFHILKEFSFYSYLIYETVWVLISGNLHWWKMRCCLTSCLLKSDPPEWSKNVRQLEVNVVLRFSLNMNIDNVSLEHTYEQ